MTKIAGAVAPWRAAGDFAGHVESFWALALMQMIEMKEKTGALNMGKNVICLFLSVAAAGTVCGQTLFQNDFEKTPPGKLPDDVFMVLDGQFEIREEAGNKFIELPGAPLETYGVLFGPAETAGVMVTARIQSTAKGRRFPVFGVGLNGVGGYKLQAAPAKGALELFKGEEKVASAPFQWKSGVWTMLRMQVRKAGDAQWKVEGKAWLAGAQEPQEWPIAFTEKAEPPAGRAAIWGSPFSGQPIRFDDLVVARVAAH